MPLRDQPHDHLGDQLRDHLGDHPTPEEVTTAVRNLLGAAGRRGRVDDRRRCETLLPLAVGAGAPGALFYLARWLRQRPPLAGPAMALLKGLAPDHPDAARLLVSNLLLGDSPVHDEVQGILDGWPKRGAHGHVVRSHGANEAVTAQLESGDPEQIAAGLAAAADECSSLPAFGVEIFTAFEGAEIPEAAQLCFVELICKYHRFDPPPGDRERCETLIDFALAHAGDAALLDVAAWLRTSEQRWLDRALEHIGRRTLRSPREVRVAAQLLGGLLSARSPAAPRVLRALEIWSLDEPSLARVVEMLAAELALQAVRQGDADKLAQLLDHRPQLDRTVDEEGFNALHHAVSLGRADLVARLIRAGVDLEVPTASLAPPLRGRTALELAALGGAAEAARLLLEAGAELRHDPQDGQGQDGQGRDRPLGLLHLAATGGVVELLERAIADGVSLELADPAGNRPLHAAAAAGQRSAVRVLLTAGAVVDVRNDLGKTPLHQAAAEGHLEAARALLEGGADPLLRDDDGELPGDVARTVAVQRLLGGAAAARGGDPVAAWLEGAVAFYRELGFFAGEDSESEARVIERLHRAHGPLSSGLPDADLGLLVLDTERVWVADYYGPEIGHPVTARAGRYRESLEALSRIGRRRVTLSKIEERWKGRRGPIEVSFWLGGRQYVIQPEFLGEYFDVAFLIQLNRSLATVGQRFALYRPRYIDLWGACIMLLTEGEQRRIEQERGGRFYSAEELEAEREALRALAAEDERI